MLVRSYKWRAVKVGSWHKVHYRHTCQTRSWPQGYRMPHKNWQAELHCPVFAISNIGFLLLLFCCCLVFVWFFVVGFLLLFCLFVFCCCCFCLNKLDHFTPFLSIQSLMRRRLGSPFSKLNNSSGECNTFHEIMNCKVTDFVDDHFCYVGIFDLSWLPRL